MGRRNRRKPGKKRKAKRADHRGKGMSLAYTGNKYRTEALVRVHFLTEVGIYESFVMTDRKLTDYTVGSALEQLIRRAKTNNW